MAHQHWHYFFNILHKDIGLIKKNARGRAQFCHRSRWRREWRPLLYWLRWRGEASWARSLPWMSQQCLWTLQKQKFSPSRDRKKANLASPMTRSTQAIRWSLLSTNKGWCTPTVCSAVLRICIEKCGCGSRKKSQCGCGSGFMLLLNYG